VFAIHRGILNGEHKSIKKHCSQADALCVIRIYKAPQQFNLGTLLKRCAWRKHGPLNVKWVLSKRFEYFSWQFDRVDLVRATFKVNVERLDNRWPESEVDELECEDISGNLRTPQSRCGRTDKRLCFLASHPCQIVARSARSATKAAAVAITSELVRGAIGVIVRYLACDT
jgi:hypothetical protein